MKDPRPDLLPPLQRYTGHFFRVVAKARREGYWPDDVAVGVISAHYGFLPSTRQIAWYEERLNRAQALVLCHSVGTDLDAFLQQAPYQQVFVAMGKVYRLTLASSRELTRLNEDGKVLWTSGGIGMMLQQTRAWLLQSAEARGGEARRERR